MRTHFSCYHQHGYFSAMYQSYDFKKRLEADLTNENSRLDVEDDDVILDEYHSEDEGLGKDVESTEDDEEEEEHTTKVLINNPNG